MNWSQAGEGDAGAGVTLDVVAEIAERDGTDPDRLSPPLGEVIDAEALERLVERAPDDALVSFVYREWRVRIRGDGAVEVSELADDR